MTVAMRGNPADTQSPGPQTPPQTDQTQQPADPVQHDEAPTEEAVLAEGQEPAFPHTELAKLDEMINRPRWVVPVLPGGELEVLMDSAINLAKNDIDTRSEACQRFFREGLSTSFTKILTDDAVSGWKYEIHKCIMNNTLKMVELTVIKLPHDWFPLLEILAMAFNPQSKFHSYNSTRPSESVPAGSQLADDELFARPPDARTPRGWLVDLVNKFGQLEGFKLVLERFTGGQQLSVSVIAAIIRPFGNCAEVLTPHAVKTYFLPIIDIVPRFLDGLTDEELKKESKTEAKNDALSGIIRALKVLAVQVPGQEEKAKELEMFRLKMILRLLQISSFNGKMNALNEVNKVITSVSYYSHRHSQIDEDEWLTADKMAEWIQTNNVLDIVLRDSLHQPQYVEKLEKIIRFMIKEKALTLPDLDRIWNAQSGKHEVIVKNVHDLLAKLAWDFSPEQLDHLFGCFQGSWAHATKKQREKLLELIRRLAEDDKEGVMAHKVLGLLWNLAHSDDVPTDIMDQALSAHTKILDYSCSQDRDSQKMEWITKFVEELKNDKWVLPALKQIKDICQLFAEPPQNYGHNQRTPHVIYRNNVINNLQQNHSIVMLVATNLNQYMAKAKRYKLDTPDAIPENILPDGKFNHVQQVQERLRFLRFLLKDGQLWLCEPQAKQIWDCLAENSVYATDREACFKWFSKLMGEEPDLDPEITKDFFEHNILQFDPSLLTENGMTCFERFFKAVNSKEAKLIPKRRGGYTMDDTDLIGLDYLWRVVLLSPDEVSNKGIVLLREIYTNLGPRLQSNPVDIHEDFMSSCMDRMKASYDTITVLEKDIDTAKITQESVRMIRVMTVLREYVAECDDAHGEERALLPLSRAFRGRHVGIIIRFPNQGRQVDDIEVWSHTNETVGSLRRTVMHMIKANSSNLKLELYINGEVLDPNDDRRLVSQVPIRDKMLLTAKLSQIGNNMPSSPDSSSDSSTGGSPHNQFDGPNIEAENCLPGVLMASDSRYAHFFFQLADLGSRLTIPKLRDGARHLLKLMPPDVHTVERLKNICLDRSKMGEASLSPSLEDMFFQSSLSRVIYNLEVTYALLMPAPDPLAMEAYEFQHNLMRSGGITVILSMITKDNFLKGADLPTRRHSFLIVMKICKLLLTAVGYAMVKVVADACNSETQTHTISTSTHNHAVLLQQALNHIPNLNSEYMVRNVAIRLGQSLKQEVTGTKPDLDVIKRIQKIGWSAAAGALQQMNSSNEEIHQVYVKPISHQTDPDEVQVAKEALECLPVALALTHFALDTLIKDKSWQCFIVDVLLLCRSRSLRICSSEQFLLMATKCSVASHSLKYFIQLLFTVLKKEVKEHPKQCHEYFQLLCRLLNYASANQITLSNSNSLLKNEIQWLKDVKAQVSKTGETLEEDSLLEGHLGVTRELLLFLSADKKFGIGAETGGDNLIKELIEDFIFPASKIVLRCRKSRGELLSDQANPVCITSATVNAAFDLLVALCTGCLQNLRCVSDMIIEMYYSAGADPPLQEWEYLPPVGPRPHQGFVGLKNAGATCYMNSVLQQLFMVEEIRIGVLSVNGAADDFEDSDSETNLDIADGEERRDEEKPVISKDEERKQYNLGLLKHIQDIFGHLACSKLQYFVPSGFWKHFKLSGEPVNLREQHDAVEFFNSVVDGLDEAMKALGEHAIFSKILGGSFADQKICKDCPHRYSREESFTTLNADIRNQHNLLESLEQYVKGDLLEGANAYHCEKCNRKVDTVKRMCIKKLPKILAIQLKRFDYDWERECAIKFNDYFEFPREFDMEPYTVQGLAKIEGEVISEDDEDMSGDSTKYKLIGVVVHSGQASGGHYYSYILHRSASDPNPKWYKFDDGEVSECKMDDDEELKNQCCGGEYLGEVFDHMLKRMSYRRQKRWWNAYILIYERVDQDKSLTKSLQDLTITNKTSQVKMPPVIEKRVRRKNIQFMHNKNQFSHEYFIFMKKLLNCNQSLVTLPPGVDKLPQDNEDMALIHTQLASSFLFHVGFHSKKSLRGPAGEWYDGLSHHLRNSEMVRTWFAQNILFTHQNRFSEYLLECPSSEVRSAFVKILVFIAHFSLQDGPSSLQLTQTSLADKASEGEATLADHILLSVLHLLKKEVADHGRHLTQYFHLFFMYANLGIAEKEHLLKLNVPTTFMLVALDEGPGPPIKYQYAELGKLYAVVSQLVRCCDVSAKCMSSVSGNESIHNPHMDPICHKAIMSIQPQVLDILFNRTSYVKKLIEDCNNSEDTTKLLRFLCWENPHFSSVVLGELLWQVAYSYTYELRPFLDLLLQVLLLEDSWQTHRIHNALKGIPEDRDGLFDTIQRSKNHYQKRAYQCIKMMVTLFTHCTPAFNMLHGNGDLKRKWTFAVEWLHDELERRPTYGGNTQYTYNNWSPPAQSNETSNGYFLERSQSAKVTLAKALELCPEEELENPEPSVEDSENGDDNVHYQRVAPAKDSEMPDLEEAAPSGAPATQAKPDPFITSYTTSAPSTSGDVNDSTADSKTGIEEEKEDDEELIDKDKQ